MYNLNAIIGLNLLYFKEMSDQTDSLLPLITTYGLSHEEGRVYLLLLRSGFLTALAISRQLQMGRTKVYRILDTLKEKQLVEFKLDDRGMQFGACAPQAFAQLVQQQESAVQNLRANLPTLLTQMEATAAIAASGSKVLYYQGVEGLKQVSYNITRAKDKLRVFEMDHLSDFLSFEFAENVRQRLVEHKVSTYDLTNKKSFAGFTDIEPLIKLYSHFRYIDPKQLAINFEVLIYNDVYATYTYKDKDIFCVEIYNQHLADMQKQLFDYIWAKAVPMEFTDAQGAARVKR